MLGHSITFSATIPSYIYSYSFNLKYENYQMFIQINTYAKSDISVRYYVDKSVDSSLYGTIGKGKWELIR